MNTWSDKDVAHYQEWFDNPRGAFALKMEKRLISRLISTWPRRNQRLLDVGCGPGLFLEFFWQSGFDVSGLDASAAMIKAAKERLGAKADLHVGQGAHLPFDDNEFDFVSLLTVLEFTEEAQALLREAERVARKGIIISFLNRFSFYYLGSGLPLPLLKPSSLRRVNWYSPLSMSSLVRSTFSDMEFHSGSVLPGPMWSWGVTGLGRLLNSFVLPSFFGAYCATRITLLPTKPLTPLFSMTREQRCS